MKTKKTLLLTIISVIAFASCSNDDNNADTTDQTTAQFTSSIAQLENVLPTKASETTWDKDDVIGIYMKEASAPLDATSLIADNKKHVTDGTGAFAPENADETIMFPKDGSKVDFIAYYPYKKETIVDFKYPVNVMNQASQAAIDFLYSNNAANTDNTTPNVALNFKHKLTKVLFNMSSDDISDLTGLKVIIKGSKTQATVSLADGSLTANNSSIANIEALTAANGAKAEAIVLPATDLSGYAFVFSLPSGDTYTWDVPSTNVFEGGKKYTFNIKLQNEGVVLVDPQGTIEDWTEGPTQNITVDKDVVINPVVISCPASASAGSTIKITGTGLSAIDNALFNGTAISLASKSDTEITLVIPSTIAANTTADLILVYSGSSQLVAATGFTVNEPPAEAKILYYGNLVMECSDPSMSKQLFNPENGLLYSACDYKNSATLKNEIYAFITWFSGNTDPTTATIQLNNPKKSDSAINQFTCDGAKLPKEFLPNLVLFRVLKTAISEENIFIEKVKNKTLTEINPQIIADAGVANAETNTPRYNAASAGFTIGDVLMFQKFADDGTTVEKVGFLEIVAATVNEKASTMTFNCYFQK